MSHRYRWPHRTWNGDPSGPHVTRPVIDHVVITGGPIVGIGGNTFQLTATAYDASGAVVTGDGVTWSIDLPNVASVSLAGLVTLLSFGTATVTATVDGRAYSISASVNPSTPAELRTRHDALGAGGLGSTRRLHYVEGVNATVLPNGSPLLNSPSTNSTTGFWCNRIENCLSPGDGNHLRPNAVTNGGNGVPCTSAGILVGAEALELPPVVMDAIIALAHREFRSKAGAVAPDIDTTIPGSAGLYQVLSDQTAGIEIQGIGKLRAGTQIIRYGANGDPNQVTFDSDEIGNWEALRSATALFGPWQSFGVGTPPIPWTKWFTTGPANLASNFAKSQFSRDLIHDDVSNIYVNKSGDPMATGRTLQWIVANGNVGNADTHQSELIINTGRSDGSQQKLWCDWCIQRYPTTWEDPHSDFGLWYGDSFQSPYQSWPNATVITNGSHGMAGISDFTLSVFARSGNDVGSYQFPFLQFIKDCDFSKRTHVVVHFAEYINDSAGRSAVDQLIRNYFALDYAKTLSPKITTVTHNLSYCQDGTQRTNNDPAIKNDLAANAVSLHGVVAVSDFLTTQFYNPYQYAGGTPTTQTACLWNGRDSHPGAQGEEVDDAVYQDSFRLGRGEDISNKTEIIEYA